MNGPQLELPAAVGFTILGASPVDGTGVLKNDGQAAPHYGDAISV